MNEGYPACAGIDPDCATYPARGYCGPCYVERVCSQIVCRELAGIHRRVAIESYHHVATVSRAIRRGETHMAYGIWPEGGRG